MDKKRLRAKMLAQRESLSWLEVQGKSHEVAQRLLLLPEYRRARTILVYLPVKKEPDTKAIIKSAWQQKKQVLVPVSRPKDKSLVLARLESFDQLTEGNYRIPEPKPEGIVPVPAEAVDLAILPAVALDLRGYRLGYGAGYFDRFLGTLRPDCVIAALAYDLQILALIPAEKHDLPVHLIITESRVLDMGRLS